MTIIFECVKAILEQEEEKDTRIADIAKEFGIGLNPPNLLNFFKEGKFAKSNLIMKDFDTLEIKKGIKVEHEHTNSTIIALKIALDHLTEDRKYYTKLSKLGL